MYICRIISRCCVACVGKASLPGSVTACAVTNSVLDEQRCIEDWWSCVRLCEQHVGSEKSVMNQRHFCSVKISRVTDLRCHEWASKLKAQGEELEVCKKVVMNPSSSIKEMTSEESEYLRSSYSVSRSASGVTRRIIQDVIHSANWTISFRRAVTVGIALCYQRPFSLCAADKKVKFFVLTMNFI